MTPQLCNDIRFNILRLVNFYHVSKALTHIQGSRSTLASHDGQWTRKPCWNLSKWNNVPELGWRSLWSQVFGRNSPLKAFPKRVVLINELSRLIEEKGVESAISWILPNDFECFLGITKNSPLPGDDQNPTNWDSYKLSWLVIRRDKSKRVRFVKWMTHFCPHMFSTFDSVGEAWLSTRPLSSMASYSLYMLLSKQLGNRNVDLHSISTNRCYLFLQPRDLVFSKIILRDRVWKKLWKKRVSPG